MTNPLGLHDHVYVILAKLAAEKRSYLGIGVQEGRCVEHVVRANPSIDVTLIDPWGPVDGGTNRGNHNHVEMRLIDAGHLGRRVYFDQTSAEALPQILARPLFDLVFVDGGHDEATAYFDLTEAWRRTRDRGILVLHDVAFPAVRAAYDRWLLTAEGVGMSTEYPDGTGTIVVRR